MNRPAVPVIGDVEEVVAAVETHIVGELDAGIPELRTHTVEGGAVERREDDGVIASPATQMRLFPLSPQMCRTPPSWMTVTLPAGLVRSSSLFRRKDDARVSTRRMDEPAGFHNLGMRRGVNSAIVTHGP